MGKPAVGDGTIRAFCETVALLRERPGLAWSMGPLPGPDGRTFGVCDLDGCVAVNGGSGRQAHGLAFVEHLLRSEVELSRCADGSCYPVLFATEVEAGPHRLAYGELVGAGRMVAANGLWCPAALDDALDAAVEAVFSGVSALTDSLAASRSGVVRVRLDDRDCVMAFVPIGNTDGWSMVSVIPDDVIMEQGNAIIGTSTVVLFIVVLVVGAAAFFGLAAFRFTRSMRAQGAETRAREELFSVLASATDEVFLMLSRDPVRVDYVSPNVDRILGVGPDEVRADCAVLELEDAEGPVDTASLDDGRTVVREGLRHNRATGEPLWFTDSLYDVEVDGGRRCMAVLSDRTRERRNEEVLREALSVAEVANESKSTFLSNVSHDIRTPMNAIVGLATLLLRDAGDPDLVRDHTRKIQASSLHMLGLLNDVLDMSKIESGKTTLNLSEFELSELAEDVVTIARPRALAKGQDFRVDVSGVRDGLVVGDKLRINQVLINIITNAVKYTPEGGHRRVRPRPDAEPPGQLRLPALHREGRRHGHGPRAHGDDLRPLHPRGELGDQPGPGDGLGPCHRQEPRGAHGGAPSRWRARWAGGAPSWWIWSSGWPGTGTAASSSSAWASTGSWWSTTSGPCATRSWPSWATPGWGPSSPSPAPAPSPWPPRPRRRAAGSASSSSTGGCRPWTGPRRPGPSAMWSPTTCRSWCSPPSTAPTPSRPATAPGSTASSRSPSSSRA